MDVATPCGWFIMKNFTNILLYTYQKKTGGEFELFEFQDTFLPFGLSGRFPRITDQPLVNPASPYRIIPETQFNGKFTYTIRFPFQYLP